MNGMIRHYLVRLKECLRSPLALVVLIAFGATSFVLWPVPAVLLGRDEVFAGADSLELALFMYLWLWPIIPARLVRGRSSEGGFADAPMPALPVGLKARITAETLVVVTFLLAVRVAGSLFLGWGDFPDFLVGAFAMLPFILACSTPSATQEEFFLRPLLPIAALFAAMELGLTADISRLLIVAALLCALALALAGRSLSFPSIPGDRYRNPNSRFRAPLEPEVRLRRDAWAMALSRHGLLLAVTIFVEAAVIALDSLVGLEDFVVEFSSIMTVSILVFLVALRPFGSRLIPAGLTGQAGTGDFLRAFSVLPVRREAVLRLTFVHAFVATAVAAVFAFSIVGYYSLLKTGDFAIVDERGRPALWKLFPLLTAMLAVPGAAVCGAAGDNLKGKLCLGYAFVIGPLNIMLGTEFGTPGREFLVMSVVSVTALAVGLPPLKYLFKYQPSRQPSRRS